jgi:hypothetical protein
MRQQSDETRRPYSATRVAGSGGDGTVAALVLTRGSLERGSLEWSSAF